MLRPSTRAVTVPSAAGDTVTWVGASTSGCTPVGACAVTVVSPAWVTFRVPSASAAVWVSSAGMKRAVTGKSPPRSGVNSTDARLSVTGERSSTPSMAKTTSPAATSVFSAGTISAVMVAVSPGLMGSQAWDQSPSR